MCYEVFKTDEKYLNLSHDDEKEDVEYKLRSILNFPSFMTKPFTIYLLLKHLSFSNPSLLTHNTADEKPIFEFYERYSLTIEVVFQGSLVQVTFQKQPYQRYLTNVRHNIMSVGLASSEDKIRVSSEIAVNY